MSAQLTAPLHAPVPAVRPGPPGAVAFPARVSQRWSPAEDRADKGTVAILPAPGQHGESHDRLAGRLAAAGYVVVALDPLPTTPLGELADLVGSLTDAPGPLTLVGWDVRSLEELQIALAARGLPTAIASAGATTAEILDVLERVQA